MKDDILDRITNGELVIDPNISRATDGGTTMFGVSGQQGNEYTIYQDYRIGSDTKGHFYRDAYPGSEGSVHLGPSEAVAEKLRLVSDANIGINIERREKLVSMVKDLYNKKDPNRDEWADWLGAFHVPDVVKYASGLAALHDADPELSEVAAWLHDIADVKMARKAEGHEEESLKMARELMQQAGYDEKDIKLVVDDAIRYHSCHDGEQPSSLEGKVLATADSMAHLMTDFYIYWTWAMGGKRPLDEVKQMTLKKIERDLNDKVFFEDIRKRLLPDYERIKELFSR